jgi:hypothetical protein
MRTSLLKRKGRKVPQSYSSASLCASAFQCIFTATNAKLPLRATLHLCGLVYLVIFSTATLQAQRYQQQQKFAFEFWHEGKVVIEGGDTLRGQIQYNMQTELIQLQANNKLETFTPRKAVFVEIFDQTVNRYRQFYSLPFALTGQYKAPVFFELLSEGKLTLMVREKVEYKTYSSFYTYGGTYTRLVLTHTYFSLKENGTIQELTGKRNDYFDMLGAKKDEVQKFAKANKLDFDNKYDIVKMTDYYNSLFK